MKHTCNCPYIEVHENYCNAVISNNSLTKVTCSNCKRTVYQDEIIQVGDSLNCETYHDECEYCIAD